MTAGELNGWLRSWCAVAEPSVDRVIVGDAGAVVRGVAVVWMPTWAALREAEGRGCNVVVAHEPTFYSHHDLDGFEGTLPEGGRVVYGRTAEMKRRWIEERGMVVVRCHDVLDTIRGGVVDALVAGLGFAETDVVRVWERYRVVRVAPAVRASELARRLAATFAPLGQPGVTFYGDPERRVNALGLGTGYGCEPWRFVELGAEMGVTIDDRLKTWVDGAWAEDSGFPLAVINHGTSEEWGVRRLAEWLRERLPALRVELIAQGCSGRWIPPRGS